MVPFKSKLLGQPKTITWPKKHQDQDAIQKIKIASKDYPRLTGTKCKNYAARRQPLVIFGAWLRPPLCTSVTYCRDEVGHSGRPLIGPPLMASASHTSDGHTPNQLVIEITVWNVHIFLSKGLPAPSYLKKRDSWPFHFFISQQFDRDHTGVLTRSSCCTRGPSRWRAAGWGRWPWPAQRRRRRSCGGRPRRRSCTLAGSTSAKKI